MAKTTGKEKFDLNHLNAVRKGQEKAKATDKEKFALNNLNAVKKTKKQPKQLTRRNLPKTN